MTPGVVRELALDLPHQLGALGPGTDQRHLAAEDIPELGELIDMGATQKPADPRDAGVVALRPLRPAVGLGVGPHGPELQHFELAAVLADPPLAVQDRAAVRELYGNSDCEQDGGEEQRDQGGADDVEDTLRGRRRRVERRVHDVAEPSGVDRPDRNVSSSCS